MLWGMSDARSRGSKSIYQGKTTRVQGVLTDVGAKAFEVARKTLAAEHRVSTASDGDTIEFLARYYKASEFIEQVQPVKIHIDPAFGTKKKKNKG